ncbi:MAG: fasciclin domain-containing protein [Pseudomonadota bacterium]
MSTATIRGLSFTFEHGQFFLNGERVPLSDIISFSIGAIDLTPPQLTITETVLAISGDSGFDGDGSDFDILRDALIATDLAGALDTASAEFTVFAPTDDAFIQLVADLGAPVAPGDDEAAFNTLVAALTDLGGSPEAALDLLADVLLFHVVEGVKTLGQLRSEGTVTTLNGATFDVNGTVLIDQEPDIADPVVVDSNIDAENGLINVIDRVLLPFDLPGNTPPSVVDIAAGNPDFSILVQALDITGLIPTLAAASDITVLAPTNDAFGALAADLGFGGDTGDADAVFGFLASTLSTLGGGDPIPLLTDILLYHVVVGGRTADEIDDLRFVPNFLGTPLRSDGTELIDRDTGLENPNIVAEDIPAASQSFVQVIDRVLLPVQVTPEPDGKKFFGTLGGDHIEGTAGDDKIVGFTGKDKLLGKEGDDLIFGGFGNDILNGGRGDDTLLAGVGNDRLTGSAGDDVMVGGFGHDIFIIGKLNGHDTIADFGGTDRIRLSSEEFEDFHDVLAAASENGGDVIITGDRGTVTLDHVMLSELQANDFLFA